MLQRKIKTRHTLKKVLLNESLHYLAIISPRVYATISFIKTCNIIFLKWGLCLSNAKSCNKTTEENQTSSNHFCFSTEGKQQRRLRPRRWFAKNVFPDFDFVFPSSINLEQRIKAVPSLSKDLQVHETNVWAVVWSVVATMDEHFQTRSRHILYSETLLASTAHRLELKPSSMCFPIADKSLYLLDKKHR